MVYCHLKVGGVGSEREGWWGHGRGVETAGWELVSKGAEWVRVEAVGWH